MRSSVVLKSCILISAIFAASLGLYAPSLYAQAQDTKDEQPAGMERQGMPPRATPADYQAHASAGSITIAAEFMGHSVPTPDAVYSDELYVVVEAGLFGAPQARSTISDSDFSLRINGKKDLISAERYAVVASSLKDPSWSPPKPDKKSSTSFGGGGQTDTPPAIVHVPIAVTHAMQRNVVKSVMPEGDRALPVAGLLFFEYHGKANKIKSVELIYNGPAGKATVPLQP
jgi:hypothetical protein